MKTPKVVWLLAAAVIAAGCGTATAFRTTWRNPESKPVRLDGQKIVVLVISTQDATRRAGEDTVAAQITARGAQGVAAWTILPTADMQDQEKTRAALTKAGAVAVVTMEIVPEIRRGGSGDFRTTMRDVSNASFWGNYNWAWNNAWYAGPPPNSSIWVETLVYSLQPDQLLWGGRSRTVNPSAVSAVFGEVANAAALEIERSGLLKSPAK
jgi:hypothetical protein